MKRHTATCGHKIEDGISCSIDDGQMSWDGHRCVTYGTYCAKCVIDYYESGALENNEISELIELAKYDEKIFSQIKDYAEITRKVIAENNDLKLRLYMAVEVIDELIEVADVHLDDTFEKINWIKEFVKSQLNKGNS